MTAFIGTKIILAEPMTEQEFKRKFKGAPEGGESHGTPGYHVQYPNPDGSKFDSWSPKDVFERSYRMVESDEIELISNN